MNKGLYDRCYPQRYNNLAQREVNLGMTGQVQNGHVLDQTVWNYHFEAGTDRLTEGGQIHLAYLARRRPVPDPCLFLQTAHDVVYDAAQSAFVEGRSFAELLAADPRVTAHLNANQIAALLDPTAYTGLCAEMARDGASRARATAAEIKSSQREGNRA